jgi:hypothetical protein
MVVLSVICTSTVWGQAPKPPKPPQVRWLEFDRVKHNSTQNGRPAANLPIFAGRNGAKILYAIQLKRPQQADLCVEVTTSYIGRFAKSDFRVKGKLMLVNATAVPRQATDLRLNVAKTAKGFRLTITKGADKLVCEVPAPLDALDRLIANPPANARKTPMLTASMKHIAGLEAQAEKQAAAGEPSGRKSASTPPPKPRYVEEVKKKFHSDILPILKRMQSQSNNTPATPQPPSEGSGKKTVLPPFKAAGTRHEQHSGWQATGLAEKLSGQLMSLTIGTGSSDKKRRGENFSWIEHRWNCNKNGSLKAIGTFVEVHANGFSTPPVHSMATNTAYLYVGVRNERTQDDIWQEFSLGRSPGVSMPFVNIVPLRRVTASGLDVRSGDEIVVLVGVCDYSSAKLGGIANGEVNARVQLIEIKVD